MEGPEMRYDLFALIILMGLIQGFFLAFIFISHTKKDSETYLGLLMLVFSILLVDILLGYTGLMIRVIWFNNVTESVNFTLGPLFYLYFKSSLNLEKTKHDWAHFLFLAFFFLYSLPYLFQPDAIKMYDYLEAMHPELVAGIPYPDHAPVDPFALRGFVNQLTILSFLIYLVASALLLFDREYNRVYQIKKLHLLWYLYLVAILLLIAVKTVFGNDVGDHLVAAYMAITIYLTDFVVIKRFVEEKTTTGRYEKSTLSDEQKDHLAKKIAFEMEQEKFYKYSNASLSELSKRVNSASHYVSQVINERLGMSYFELLADYRIKKACEILKEDSSLTIEQVAFEVGYNSKSAFNKKFKELKGVTPTEFKVRGKIPGSRLSK